MERVSVVAVKIGKRMGLSIDQIENIKTIGLLHDVGKSKFCLFFRQKTTSLSKSELRTVWKHPKASYDILRSLGFSEIIITAVLQHHERIDGSGYPNGLCNGQILIEAKIVAVADVIDAMSSDRLYNPKLDACDALKEVIVNSGKRFDADVVEACMQVFSTCKYPGIITTRQRQRQSRQQIGCVR